MAALLAHPDAALTYLEAYAKTYMEAYMEAYMEGALGCMNAVLECPDAAWPEMDKACSMSDLDPSRGAVASHDDRTQPDMIFPLEANKVFLARDANQDSAKNQFLEGCPEARDTLVVVLVDETDEFLVLMDENRTPKPGPGSPVVWEDEDSKNQ
jgi:hypothetical protein